MLICCSRRRQPCKQQDQSAASRPLMANNSDHNSAPIASTANGGREAQSNGQQPCPPTPNDPVQLRRLHFKTAAMVAHPPVPMSQLAQHIESLRSDDNLRFSQEYEARNSSFFSIKLNIDDGILGSYFCFVFYH